MQRDNREPDINLSDYCVFKRFGAAYLAKSAHVDTAVLQNWRAPQSLFGLLRKGIGLLPGMRIRSAEIDGQTIRYWDFGARRGNVVVLLHGFSANKENWINVVYLLGRSYRVLVPDIPGFGESSFNPSADYTIEKQSKRIASWFASLGAECAHWVGNSMGGAIAGVIAALEPQMVRTLTLMGAAGIAGEQLTAFEADLAEGVNGLIPVDQAGVARVFKLITGAGGGLQCAVLSRLIGKEQVVRAPLHQQLFREVMTPADVPSGYWACAVEAPTLIIWGDQDRVLHPCEAKVFQTLIPGSELVLFEGVGHVPMMEAPFRTARTLRAFWQRAGKGGR